MFGWGRKEEEEIKPLEEEEFIIPPSPQDDPPIIITEKETSRNPGKYEDLNSESRGITDTQEAFDGLVCDISRTFGERFQIAHRLALGSSAEPPTYNFNAHWAGGVDPTNRRPPKTMLVTRVSSEGQVVGRAHHYLTNNLQVKLVGQTTPEPHNNGANVELDYEGRDWSGQFKWMSPGTYGVTYHQSVTRHFSLGCDLFYRYQQGMTIGSYGGRYSTDKWVATAMMNPMTTHFTYTQKVSDKVGLATEWMMQQGREGQVEPMWVLGLEYRLRMSVFKAHIDSTAKVFAHLEELINPQMKCSLSAELDHKKKQYKFGMGISLNL